MTSFLQIFQFPGQIEAHNFKIINQVINLFFSCLTHLFCTLKWGIKAEVVYCAEYLQEEITWVSKHRHNFISTLWSYPQNDCNFNTKNTVSCNLLSLEKTVIYIIKKYYFFYPRHHSHPHTRCLYQNEAPLSEDDVVGELKTMSLRPCPWHWGLVTKETLTS